MIILAATQRRLGITPGSKLDFELEGDRIRVRTIETPPPCRTAFDAKVVNGERLAPQQECAYTSLIR